MEKIKDAGLVLLILVAGVTFFFPQYDVLLGAHFACLWLLVGVAAWAALRTSGKKTACIVLVITAVLLVLGWLEGQRTDTLGLLVIPWIGVLPQLLLAAVARLVQLGLGKAQPKNEVPAS